MCYFDFLFRNKLGYVIFSKVKVNKVTKLTIALLKVNLQIGH